LRMRIAEMKVRMNALQGLLKVDLASIRNRAARSASCAKEI